MILFFLFLTLFQPNYSQNFFLKEDKNITFVEANINYLKITDLTADVVLVKDFDDKILFQKNPEKPKEIASITKLMSAYLGYKIFSSKDYFIFDEEAINQEGDVGYFNIGEKISRDEILKASLISSSNDAIYLLAKTYSLEDFIFLMNQKAKEWGMLNTTFNGPTGLEKNFSTANDLYIMLKKIYLETPEIFALTRIQKATINKKNFWTTNILLPKYSSIIVGAKTGYKETSGENLVMILKFDNSSFITIIILDSKNRFQDAEKIIKALKIYYAK